MEELKTYTILSASGTPALDADLQRFSDMNVVGTCRMKSDILLYLGSHPVPDCMIISDVIKGDEELIELLIRVRKEYPSLRIIYLAGTLDQKNVARMDQLGMLVINGIYDIIIGKINPTLVRDVVIYPKAPDSVAYLKEHLLNAKAEIQNAASGFEYEGFGQQEEKLKKSNNIFIVWSAKPGSGKSFISANLAAAVARYGVDRPRVALIDGDLQNLSIGNILSVKPDANRNVKVAMQAISDIINGRCDTEERLRRAEKQVKNSFVRYKGLSNLDILAGSSLTPQEAYELKLSPQHYQKLMEIISPIYDYIIVDLNSSIIDPATYTLMSICKEAYCIINLDYNNILNSARYKDSMKAFKIDDKIHYILNQDFTNDGSGHFGTDKEELNLTGDNVEEKIVHLDARIPNVEPSIFFNRQLDGRPIILYKKRYTEKIRLAILKLAQRICPIDEAIITELKESQKTEKKSFFSFLKKKENEEIVVDDNTDKNSELDYDVDSVNFQEVLQNVKSEEAMKDEARK